MEAQEVKGPQKWIEKKCGGMSPFPINICLNKNHAIWNEWPELDSAPMRSVSFIDDRTASWRD